MNLLPEGYQFSEDEIEDMLYIADKQEKGNVDFARFQVLSQKYKMNLNKEQQEKIQSIINKHL
jgi:Ca2+-binding EF-hand superfamily protein